MKAVASGYRVCFATKGNFGPRPMCQGMNPQLIEQLCDGLFTSIKNSFIFRIIKCINQSFALFGFISNESNHLFGLPENDRVYIVSCVMVGSAFTCGSLRHFYQKIRTSGADCIGRCVLCVPGSVFCGTFLRRLFSSPSFYNRHHTTRR